MSIPERLKIGSLVTWGDGYASGIIVGCFSFADHLTGVRVEQMMGVDPLSTYDNGNIFGYMILVNGITSGPKMFEYRMFDTEGSLDISYGRRDVRPYVEVKK